MRALLGVFVLLTSASLAAAQAVGADASDNTRPLGETSSRGVVGTWVPHPMEHHSVRSAMIVGSDGRFAMIVAPRENREKKTGAVDGLNAVSGSWELADDGGELVLTLDNHLPRNVPGTTRYVQMLLLGDELRPYPGMEKRFPIAATSWLRANDERAALSDANSPGTP